MTEPFKSAEAALMDAIAGLCDRKSPWHALPLPNGYDSYDTLAADYLLGCARVYLNVMPYEDYLKTEHWLAVRDAAKARAKGACQLCNATVVVDVHHRTYERRGSELSEDLIVLCRDCHSKFHGKLA